MAHDDSDGEGDGMAEGLGGYVIAYRLPAI
jgi:hypothetical protein